MDVPAADLEGLPPREELQTLVLMERWGGTPAQWDAENAVRCDWLLKLAETKQRVADDKADREAQGNGARSV